MNPGQVPSKESPDVPVSDDFQAIGLALRVLQLNVEGLSSAKRSIISDIAVKNNVDFICLQETHLSDNIAGRLELKVFDVLLATPHALYGRVTYVRTEIADAQAASSRNFCDVIRIGGYSIANIYKPPSTQWDQEILPQLQHPPVYVGDFNSHHTDWGYSEADADGDRLVEWATNNDLTLSHDVKQRETFYSVRW